MSLVKKFVRRVMTWFRADTAVEHVDQDHDDDGFSEHIMLEREGEHKSLWIDMSPRFTKLIVDMMDLAEERVGATTTNGEKVARINSTQEWMEAAVLACHGEIPRYDMFASVFRKILACRRPIVTDIDGVLALRSSFVALVVYLQYFTGYVTYELDEMDQRRALCALIRNRIIDRLVDCWNRG